MIDSILNNRSETNNTARHTIAISRAVSDQMTKRSHWRDFTCMWDLSILRVELYANDEKAIPILDRRNALPQVRYPDGDLLSYDLYPTPTIRAETVNLTPLGTLSGLAATPRLARRLWRNWFWGTRAITSEIHMQIRIKNRPQISLNCPN